MFCRLCYDEAMKNTATIIKIGDSAGITIPAKQLKKAGLKPGDEVEYSYKPVTKSKDEVMQSYAKFKSRYGQTLKNLADR